MLGEDGIELKPGGALPANCLQRLVRMPSQSGRVEQVFEIPVGRVAAHGPPSEGVYLDAMVGCDGFPIFEERTKQMHLMAPANQFPDEVNRLGRSTSAGREVRFMGKESQAHGTPE
jgi:hypothetical protein